MRVLVQRVDTASVTIDGKVHAEIKKGLLLFVCFESEDTHIALERMVQRVCNLRIFEDDNAKMNLNCTQMPNHEILSISQFTLSWEGKKGNRPSFTRSMKPELAATYFDRFNDLLNQKIPTKRGIFAADMKITSINDGPVTFMLNS